MLPAAAWARLVPGIEAIRWTGRATVHAGDRQVEIGVDTRVEPFLRARSTSWLLVDGPKKARTMIVEATAAFVERDGVRTPLPAAQAEHERQQFGLYGYLLDVQDPIRVDNEVRPAFRKGYPPILFRLGISGVPKSADYPVDGPDGRKMRQHIVFTGRREHRGVVWPGGFTISVANKPYFTLDIAEFAVERA